MDLTDIQDLVERSLLDKRTVQSKSWIEQQLAIDRYVVKRGFIKKPRFIVCAILLQPIC